MNSQDVNGSRERSAVEDRKDSGRRFVCPSLSSYSDSEDTECLITLTASTLSLSDISSQDEDLDEIDAALSRPVTICKPESSGVSSATPTTSGYGSFASGPSFESLQHVGMSSFNDIPDIPVESCSFRDADISSSSHGSDEFSSYSFYFMPRSLLQVFPIDQGSRSAEDEEYLAWAEIAFLKYSTSSSDEETHFDWYTNYGSESTLSLSSMDPMDCWSIPQSSVTEKEYLKVTKVNVSMLCDDKSSREDLIHNWVLQDNTRCNECDASYDNESSGMYKNDESDFEEELGFKDSFAFATKPSQFKKSSEQIQCNVVENLEIVSARQIKVSFAPPERLVTVRHFERSAEELENDKILQEIWLDSIHFKKRIMDFKEEMDPFLKQEFRSLVMKRNGICLEE